MELKKILLYAAIPATLIFAPLVAISTPCVGCYQSQIDKNPNTESSKNWQIRLGDLCMKTMRYELAAQKYGLFVDRYPDDPRRPDIMWEQSNAYEVANNQYEHQQVLVRLVNQYPDHERGRQADEHLNREGYFNRTPAEPPTQ